MPSLRAVLLIGALGLALFAACDRRKDAPSQSSSAPARSHAPASVAPVSSSPLAAKTVPGCRAMRVSGDVKAEGGARLEPGAMVDGRAWLELAGESEVWLKHPPTGRELTVRGPARVLACRQGREELLLARGKVVTSTGAGVRPGAEVLIATPQGVVRYGNAELEATSGDGKLALEVRAGEAWVDAADPAIAVRANPLRGKEKLSVRGKLGPEALITRCQKLAEVAGASAERVLSPPADAGGLGDRAAVQVRDRRAARAACSIAAAATGQMADQDARRRLWGLVERWEALWQAVPRPPR